MQPDEMRALRKAAGLTQQELADEIGMSRIAINKMEAAKAVIEKRTELAVRYVAEHGVDA